MSRYSFLGRKIVWNKDNERVIGGVLDRNLSETGRGE
jgi:hypothetical protein